MFMPKPATMHPRNRFQSIRDSVRMKSKWLTGASIPVLVLFLAASLSAQAPTQPNNQSNPQTNAPANQSSDTVKVPNQQQGEQPSREDSGVFVFRKQVEEVQLHATVMDDKHRLVTDLARNDFQVFENGQPQQITSFRREDIPVSIGII